jgi:serine/arginine repetitive matrix protein 1
LLLTSSFLRRSRTNNNYRRQPTHKTAATMAMSVDQKILKATKFPPEFDKRVDTSKVNIDLMKKWIAGKITTILGYEDDVVVETCYNLLEENRFVRFPALPAVSFVANFSLQPKIKEIQIQLGGFLNKDCAPFCKELWNLMLSAQESTAGVPKELLEAKKLELKQEQVRNVPFKIGGWAQANLAS